jgi:hypothetical protein
MFLLVKARVRLLFNGLICHETLEKYENVYIPQETSLNHSDEPDWEKSN